MTCPSECGIDAGNLLMMLVLPPGSVPSLRPALLQNGIVCVGAQELELAPKCLVSLEISMLLAPVGFPMARQLIKAHEAVSTASHNSFPPLPPS